jgi:hypothetical protein
VTKKVITWLLFGVGSAVVPLLVSGIIYANHDQLTEYSLTWEHGELVLISMTLLITAAGELLAHESRFGLTKIFVLGLSGILILIACVWYVDVWKSLVSHEKFRQDFLKTWSPAFFFICLFNSSACIMLSKGSEPYR